MKTNVKSSVEEIRARFDGDVERFSNLETGQVATVDAAASMELLTRAASVAHPRATTVLDVGCGAGNYSVKLREFLPEVRFTLVDLSTPMLQRARQRLGSGAHSTVPADIRDLDFPPGSFDIILAAAVLHHLRSPEEWERVFGNFYRWLKPSGGLWVFDLVAHESSAVQGLMWKRYEEYLESQGGVPYREKVCAYMEKEDTPAGLTYQIEQLRQAGFAHIDILHKNSCFASYGGQKKTEPPPIH